MNNKDLEQYISSVNRSIAWSNQFQNGEKARETTAKLIGMRRKAKKLHFANSNKPSAALYGESQVGKSYLVKNFFSLPGKGFEITDPSTGKAYNFLEDINPRGNNVEATSVVTRFSLDLNLPEKEYPVKINLTRPIDLALILIDSRLSELQKTLEYLTKNDIDEKLNAITSRYGKSDYHQEIFGIDEMFDIKEYLETYFSSSPLTLNLADSDFWNVVPPLMHKVPHNEWNEVLEIFWSMNHEFKNLFQELISHLESVNFITEAYCKFDAVLREHGTLLDVNRLHQIKNPESHADATKYIKEVELFYMENGALKKSSLEKNFLCALSSEIVFKIDNKLKEHARFVENIDLLDFPGARERTRIELDTIENNISDIILRGKVAYLFNRYSSSYRINNLIFCHRSEQLGAKKTIPLVLNNWITEYVGKNSEQRQALLDAVEVPPLFVVFGWFNEDLKFDTVNDKTDESLETRWHKRFERIFINEVQTKSYDWSTNWTTSNKYFQNMYMLRDFIWSEQGSNIYKGFGEHGEERERVDPAESQFANYWDKLKSSFVNYPQVNNYFKNPEQAWNDSATINNDGTKPIIKNLYKASNPEIRKRKFNSEFSGLKIELNELLSRYHENEDSSKQIQAAINKYGKLQMDLDTTTSKDIYFFGNLMKKFHIDESVVYNFYKKNLSNPELVIATERKPYTLILLQNPGLSTHRDKYEENLEILRSNYNLLSISEVENYFKEKDIDLNELFFGEANRVLSNSKYLAEKLAKHWIDEHLSLENLASLVQSGMSETSIEDLQNNIIANFKRHKVEDSIAMSIRKYVDRYDRIEEVQEMIGDMSACIINNFVNTMGFDLYNPERIQNLKETAKKYGLDLNVDFDELSYASLDEKSLVDLFEKTSKLDEILNQTTLDRESLKNIPSFSHYVKWSEQLKLSFINGCDIPTYDVDANRKLGELILELQPTA